MAYRHLNDFSVTPQSWYPLCRSGQVRRGRVRSVAALNRRIAVYREPGGTPRALDARCVHMGADLGLGRVIEDRLQCPLHRWEYGPDGGVMSAPFEPECPPRRVRAYPAQDRYGYLWMFNGPTPLFDLPEVDPSAFLSFTLPAQTFKNHPHFLTANGLDWRHMHTLHDMELEGPSRSERPGPYHVRVDHVLRPGPVWLRAATGTRRRFIDASFETFGANTALISVGRVPAFHLMFANTPQNDCTTRTRAVIFLSRRSPTAFASSLWMYVILTTFVLLRQDHRMFQTTDFLPGFTDVDEAFRLFAEVVSELPTG